MPNKRDLKLTEYGITMEQYRELYYHCRQYDDMRRRLWTMGAGQEWVAVRLRTERDIKEMEQTAIEIAPKFAQELLYCIVHDVPGESPEKPWRQSIYNRLRREYYARMAMRRNMIPARSLSLDKNRL